MRSVVQHITKAMGGVMLADEHATWQELEFEQKSISRTMTVTSIAWSVMHTQQMYK